MPPSDSTVADQLTGMTAAERQSLIAWFAQQGEETRLNALKLQGDLAQQRRTEYRKEFRTEFYYAMLLLALAKMRWTEQAQHRKQALSATETERITAMRVDRLKSQRKKKNSPQKELIRLRYYEEIRQLREKGLSWREVAKYIALHHKKTISHGYLQQCFDELSAERTRLEVPDAD